MANGIISSLQIGSGDIGVFTTPYGVCSTTAETAAKTVTVNGDFVLATGARVMINFSKGVTFMPSATMSLNVNSTGAKYVRLDPASGSGTDTTLSKYFTSDANRVYEFVYDGTYWLLLTRDHENIITDSEIDTVFGATLTSITYSLGTNCVSSNTFEGIYNGDSYITTLSTVNNYKITEVKVLMNNTDITSSVYNSSSKTIHIPTVNGTVKITATTRAPYTYTITYNLTRCSSSNTATTIQEGQSYSTEITCTSSYQIDTCDVSMSGGAATASASGRRKYIINIPEVTGNITITGYAV